MAATEKLLWGGDWPIEVFALNGSLAPITGSATILLSIRRKSDDFFYDFNDDTFKASGWTTLEAAMSQVDATNAPGDYSYDWDTSAVTNEAADDLYVFRVRDSSSTAKNLPTSAEVWADGWVKDILDNQALQATSAELAALEAHGDSTWATAVIAGLATSAELAALEAHGDSTWATAVIAGLATSAELAAAVAAIITQGDAAWITADLTGIALTTDVTAARDAIITQGDAAWVTAVVSALATSAELAALEAHGDSTWATAVIAGLATSAELAAAVAAIIAQGDSTWATVSLIGIATTAEVNAARDDILTQGGAGPWTVGSLSAAQAIQLQETWTALGMNKDAPASYDASNLYVRALLNPTPIDVVISIVGTTVILTRQP